MKKLPLSFYTHHDVLWTAQQLLGKVLMTNIEGEKTGGIIIETEAYRGPEDKGSHAYNNKRTKRNEVMYSRGGIAYVYRCYGIHNLFNVVTNEHDIPHAVLIRALYPVEGIGTMLKRRQKKRQDAKLTSGPGTLTQALGITTQDNGESLLGSRIWLEDKGYTLDPSDILIGPRIGIDYAGEHALLPWRFRIKWKET
jgi:DNA-3-methyladenine glycosylase